MKIGLFGGSFNPVHSTHIDVAKGVMSRLGLDLVLLVPAGNPYHKFNDDMLPAELRYEFALEAVKAEEGLEVCDIDMRAEGPTYTVRTLLEAARRYPGAELFFIMGQDSLETFTQWKDWQRIPELANIVAVSREQVDHGSMELMLRSIFPELDQVSPGVWKRPGGYSIYIIGDFDFTISSTLVRQVWREGGKLAEYVPLSVAKCIKKYEDQVRSCWR